MDVFGAIFLLCWVYEGVHFYAYSQYVEVCEVEDFEFFHDGFGVCVRWLVFDNSQDFFLCSNEWLHVRFCDISCSPYSNGANKVRVHMHVIEFSHGARRDEFVCKFEILNHWLELFDDVGGCLVVLEVVFDVETK